MHHVKLKDNSTFGYGDGDFTIHVSGCCDHLGHVTWTIYIIFHHGNISVRK